MTKNYTRNGKKDILLERTRERERTIALREGEGLGKKDIKKPESAYKRPIPELGEFEDEYCSREREKRRGR